MATRRDQLQSYQFLLQRVVSALVYRKTDPAQSPFRKAGGAVFAGVMISILALAATVAISFFATMWGVNEEWWHGNIIVLEEDTGTKYVVFPPSDQATEEFPSRLYPVTNFASAVLLAGTTQTMEVSRNSLTGEDIDGEVPPRGMPIGIPGAPDSIPAPEQLITSSLATVCTAPQDEDEPLSMMYIGTTDIKGDGLQESQAVLIEHGEEVYLVDSGGYKHLVHEPTTTLSYLGLNSSPRATAAAAFIKALPTGEDLAVPGVSNSEGTSDLGHAVGTVFEHTVGGNTTYYVALSEGAARITELQALLLMGANNQSGYITDGAQAAAEAAEGNDGLYYPDARDEVAYAAALPLRLPEIPDNWSGDPACVTFDDNVSKILVNADLPGDSGIDTQQVSDSGNVLADRIVLPPGRGMLVQTGDDAGAFSLIVSGQNFPIKRVEPNQEQRYKIMGAQDPLVAMGYAETSPATLNGNLLSLIPTGPALDPQAAIARVFDNEKDIEE